MNDEKPTQRKLIIYDAPKVTLLTEQVFYNPLDGEWDTDAMSAGEAAAEFAGRLCYLSYGTDVSLGAGHATIKGRNGNAAYLENIRRQKHGSVLEHAVFGLLIEQVSRSLTHELVRHRAGMSFSMLSQRYVDESRVAFVKPPEIDYDSAAYDVFYTSGVQSLTKYEALLREMLAKLAEEPLPKTEKLKRARQTAREVLPNCTETKIVVTGNGRSWRHFLELRGNRHADRQIRALAVTVARLLKDASPNLFEDVVIWTDEDGFESVALLHPGV
jgi:thymidylate synthase (FAD)